MNLTSCPMPHAQVAAQVVDDEAVIILADAGEVDILDPVGTRIWELIDGERTVQEIVDTIVEEYDVPVEQARQDIQEFLQVLENDKIVELRE